MRALTAAETAIIAAGNWTSLIKVYIHNGVAAYNEFSAFLGENWVSGVKITEHVDRPIATASITLLREIFSLSLSPLMEGSKANLPAGSFVPAIDIGRRVYIEAALSPVGGPAVNYTRIFDGYVDDWEEPAASSELRLECRDLAGLRLQDRMIEVERFYSSEGAPGVPIETIIAGSPPDGTAATTILGDNLTVNAITGYGPDLATVPLFVPTSPSWNVRQKKDGWLGPLMRIPVLDALRAGADMIGWECRYKWDDAAGSYKLTLFRYDRTKTSVDFTLSGAQLRDLTLRQSISRVRNWVDVFYIDSTTKAESTSQNTNAASETKYGHRYFYVPELASSNIDSFVEADKMGQAILKDLQTAKVEAEFEIPYRKAPELGDIAKLLADSFHSDKDYDLGIVGLTHSFGGRGLNGITRVIAVGGKSGDQTPKVTGKHEGWMAMDSGRAGVAAAKRTPYPGSFYTNAYANTAQTITAGEVTLVKFDKKVSDLRGTYDASTGIETAPHDGLYSVKGAVTVASLAAGTTLSAAIYVFTPPAGGVNVVQGLPMSTDAIADVQATVEVLIWLLTNQQVTIRAQHNDGSNRSTVVGVSQTYLTMTCIRTGALPI